MSTDTDNFTPFDAANYLNTVEDFAAYLEAIIDETNDDPTDRPSTRVDSSLTELQPSHGNLE